MDRELGTALCSDCYPPADAETVARRARARKEGIGLWRRIFFSFQGRISRGTFWAVWIVMILANLLIQITIGITIGIVSRFSDFGDTSLAVGLLLYVLLLVLVCWVAVAMQVKRWHDLGQSGWMVLVNFTIIGLPIALVFHGFIKGTAGPNKYGEDPLQSPTA